MFEDSVFINIPSDRIKKLKRHIRRPLNRVYVLARGLARLTGQFVSISWDVGPAKLYYEFFIDLNSLYQRGKTY